MRCFYSLLFSLFVVLCSSCSKKNNYLPIPKDSEVIIRLNTSEIGKKIFIEKAKDFSFEDLFSFEGKDSTRKENFWERLLNAPGEAGIEYLDPVYFFQYEGEKFSVISLDNKKNFDEFIKVANGKINDFGNGFSNSQLSDLSIAWNKNLAIFQWNNDNSILKKIIELKKEETVFGLNDFQKTASLSDDIVCYFHSAKLLPEGSLVKQLKVLNKDASVIKINFEKGIIHLEVDNLIHPETEKLFGQLTPDNISRVETQNTLASLYFNIHPSILERLNENSPNTNGIIKRNLISGLTGEFYGNISKINIGTKTYTTYEMDEDFNKVEVVDTINYYFPSLYILLPIKNESEGKTIMNNLEQEGYLTHIKENYTFGLLNFPMQLSVNDNYIVATDSIPVLNQKKNKLKLANSCILLNINHSKEVEKLTDNKYDISALKQIQIIGTKVDKEKVKINARILFNDPNKNSLIQLIDILKSPIAHKPVL